jgi:hypothetical protein
MEEKMKTIIILVFFWIITAIAAFEAGVIFEFKGIDNNTKRLTKVEVAVGELAGKVTAHDAIIVKIKH